jgi:nucleotide-binding universal stress UspA family protein
MRPGSESSPAQIVLLYVVEIPKYQLNPEVYSASERIRSTLNDLETRALARLESLCKEIGTPGIECTARVRTGTPYEEILAEAERIVADLIVVACKGGSALPRMLLGSTAERQCATTKATLSIRQVFAGETAATHDPSFQPANFPATM